MTKARIDDTLQTHYEDDDFTDPWATPETVGHAPWQLQEQQDVVRLVFIGR